MTNKVRALPAAVLVLPLNCSSFRCSSLRPDSQCPSHVTRWAHPMWKRVPPGFLVWYIGSTQLVGLLQTEMTSEGIFWWTWDCLQQVFGSQEISLILTWWLLSLWHNLDKWKRPTTKSGCTATKTCIGWIITWPFQLYFLYLILKPGNQHCFTLFFYIHSLFVVFNTSLAMHTFLEDTIFDQHQHILLMHLHIIE